MANILLDNVARGKSDYTNGNTPALPTAGFVRQFAGIDGVMHCVDSAGKIYDMMPADSAAQLADIATRFKTGTNLFNKNAVTSGKYPSYTDGALHNNASYTASEYMPILSSMSYTMKIKGQLAFYTSGQVFISGLNPSASPASFISPSNAAFIRITTLITDLAAQQFELGTTSTIFEPYKKVLDFVVGAELSDINNILESTKMGGAFGTSLNLYDKTNITSGKYITYNSGNAGTNAAYCYSGFIAVDPSSAYKSNFGGTSENVTFYDVNFAYISGLNQTPSFTTPSNAKYLRLSLLLTSVDAVMLVKGSVLPSGYMAFGKVLKRDHCEAIMPPNTLIVSPTGSLYSTIQSAVNAATEGDIIRVMPGTYVENVQAFTKRIILIGTDRNQCILKSNDGRYDYPPLEVSCGYIENMTIIAEYVNGVSNEINGSTSGSYAVHCENEYGVSKTLELHHCRLKSDFFPALGMGMRKDFTLIIDDCDLENSQISGRGNYSTAGSLGALYFHDSIGVVGAQHLKVKDSVFRSALGYSMCVYDMLTAGNTLDCEFINCTFWDVINHFVSNIWWRNETIPWGGHFSIAPISHGNTNSQLNS